MTPPMECATFPVSPFRDCFHLSHREPLCPKSHPSWSSLHTVTDQCIKNWRFWTHGRHLWQACLVPERPIRPIEAAGLGLHHSWTPLLPSIASSTHLPQVWPQGNFLMHILNNKHCLRVCILENRTPINQCHNVTMLFVNSKMTPQIEIL